MPNLKPLVDTRVSQKKQKSYPHIGALGRDWTTITIDRLLSIAHRIEATVIK